MVFQPEDPGFADRVRRSFGLQTVMVTIGAELRTVNPGSVEIVLPFRADLCQQHGFLHAGIVATLVDSACGYAALTLMSAEAAVLTVEFKANFLAPAKGREFIARGRVVRPGKRISVCTGEVLAFSDGGEKTICLMQATMASLTDHDGLKD
ncbi:MAG TPA: PaaI family thioesterase [Hyphomicrobium sp.]|nr:PaaI family thioesterase [Hyphomicrobium sp.]